jgi:hypothetical protein
MNIVCLLESGLRSTPKVKRQVLDGVIELSSTTSNLLYRILIYMLSIMYVAGGSDNATSYRDLFKFNLGTIIERK